MLSTTDNPYNPWTQYDLWLTKDEELGYYTNNYLARIYKVFEDAGIKEEEALRLAIADIIETNIYGTYCLVPQP